MVATQPVSMRGATVTPASPFRPDEDVKKLYEAIHVTKDNNGISSVLCFKSNAQRQEIAKRYKETFRKPLVDDLGSLEGEFKELVTALLEDSVVFDAKQLKKSLEEQKGLALMEILFTRSSTHLGKIKKAYRDLYQKDVDDDLDKENKLHDRLLLKFLVDCKRDETAKVDPEEAERSAQALCHPQTEKQHVAAGKLYEMLATKSHEQLRSIFDRYELISGNTVEQLIEEDFPGNDEGVCLMAAIRAVRSTVNFFAAELKAFFN
ncbi:annexin A3, partial [Aphelenchoides avenae]